MDKCPTSQGWSPTRRECTTDLEFAIIRMVTHCPNIAAAYHPQGAYCGHRTTVEWLFKGLRRCMLTHKYEIIKGVMVGRSPSL